ncbi:DUF4145 domain-containing protein [Devosia sp. MC532]|uniref:DUF4145 domain-containing protein n=1 Tax=Devosia sp. MC532 TaxID=2799788 RepID=UPI0018F7A910|nr:DUF4145 domain-containing protein [Devosia sp. MC532]MBJ7577287.1 DUF4145 domain-containing protein [Devosia sp. MC532]
MSITNFLDKKTRVQTRYPLTEPILTPGGKQVHWTCPFCQTTQLTSTENSYNTIGRLSVGVTKRGILGIHYSAIRCLNGNCKELTLTVAVGNYGVTDAGRPTLKNVYNEWKLYPSSNAKPQPDYIPAAIVSDYREASLIVDLSPKASATLARRCLQGIIRDFCGIQKDKLHDAIQQLKKDVEEGTANRSIDPATLNAIDAVRKVGNIGAHMEKDINLIVDVEPSEAMLLLNLIESLFEEWYVARHNRDQRLQEVVKMAEGKETQRRPKAPADATGADT